MMTGKIQRIAAFVDHYSSKPIIENSRELAEGGLKFLTVITRPDGYLPELGDTRKGRLTKAPYPDLRDLSWYNHYQYLVSGGRSGKMPGETTFVFPKSGYFIHRDFWDNPGENKATQLIMKCGYLSNAHRHDDDGNLLLYGLGEDWLIDSGRYGYKKDKYRRYAIGPTAHNLSMPFDYEVNRDLERRFRKHEDTWGITDWSGSHVQCESHMFKGYHYKRILEIRNERKFRVVDTLSPKSDFNLGKSQFITVFRTTYDKEVFINQQNSDILIINASGNAGLRITFDRERPSEIELVEGEADRFLSFETADWLKMQPAKAIVIRNLGSHLETTLELSLLRHPDISGYRKLTKWKAE
jgi:hypothetical protein